MSDGKEDASVEKNRKNRSPAYPAIGLETCLKAVRKVWDGEKRSVTSGLVVAKHAGYNSMSGPARTGISAMKKFGLLLDEGADRVRVSEDAIRYFLVPGEVERLQLARAFAMKPSLMSEIMAENPGGLPSDDTLIYKLVTERDFGTDGAKTFVRSLRETVRFAQLDAEGYSSDVPQAAQELPQANVATAEAHRQRPAEGRGARAISVELSDGTRVSIEPSAPLTAETFDELLEYMAVYQKVLQKRASREEREPTEPGA